MMRGFVVVLAVLLAAGTAFGQAQYVSARAPVGFDYPDWDASLVGSGGPYVNDLVLDPDLGDIPWDADLSDGFSMTIDVSLEAGANGMKAAGVWMSEHSGLVTYDAAVDWAGGGNISNYGDVANPPFGSPSNAQGWSVSTANAELWLAGTLDGDDIAVPSDLDGGAQNEMGTIAADTDVGCTDGFFGAITLHLPPLEQYPMVITLDGYIGDMSGTKYTNVDYATITILPEPASLLLLLGALPLLRRRR